MRIFIYFSAPIVGRITYLLFFIFISQLSGVVEFKGVELPYTDEGHARVNSIMNTRLREPVYVTRMWK